eukprot:gb/GEZJ01002721.1/.p1 GENE.gb/GEZJ01002721.1/~~gb/GEZJ01002721.1/.p1  ORF type:complete len:653 (-),score=118.97 gb/GEZJ01002721.1/:25-1983(-)
MMTPTCPMTPRTPTPQSAVLRSSCPKPSTSKRAFLLIPPPTTICPLFILSSPNTTANNNNNNNTTNDDDDDDDDDYDEDDDGGDEQQLQLHHRPIQAPDPHLSPSRLPSEQQHPPPANHHSKSKLNSLKSNGQYQTQSPQQTQQTQQTHQSKTDSDTHDQLAEFHQTMPTHNLARTLPSRSTATIASNLNRCTASQAASRASQSSHASFVFSEAWYDQMCIEAIPLRHRIPPDVTHPSFFRVMCGRHNALFPPEPAANTVNTHTAEANVLYQVLAFLHENLNQLFDMFGDLLELDGVEPSDPALVQLRSSWKHLRGITEMLECRYDLLCGYRHRDYRQTALVEAHMTPALGHSALSQAVNDDMRGVPSDTPQAPAETREKMLYNEFSCKAGDEQQGSNEEKAPGQSVETIKSKSLLPRKKKNLTVSWADRQAPSIEFVFVLRRYDMINASVVRGAWHEFGGYLWRLIIYPRKEKGLEGFMWLYLQCGGSCFDGEDDDGDENGGNEDAEEEEEEGRTEANEVDEQEEDECEDEREDGDRVSWCRPTQFVMRIVHSTAPLARAAVRSGRVMFDSVETLEQSKWYNESDEASLYPDIKRQEYHVFRSTADDWGYGIVRFCALQPGLYADNDMNVVFTVRIMLLSFEQPLPRRDSV